ncbi:MAG: hypothetical protein WBI20_11075 [Burkholderiaceae bacterium]
MNLTGGLLWHWRAWQRQSQWQEACTRIAQWLDQVQPVHQELLIIGASAGWMMPVRWLQGFKKVTTFDTDRWAAPLFRWRHGRNLQASGTQLQCHTSDALTPLDTVLRTHPKAAVLFDNVLGQLRFQQPSIDQTTARIEKITRSLRSREWGSVHDAYSGPLAPARSATPTPYRKPSTQEDLTNHLAQTQVRLAPEIATFSAGYQPQGEWLDHLTSKVFPSGTPVHHIAWPYSPDYGHWLQAGWVRP